MQTILVTGANQGIGLALCKELCKEKKDVKVFLGSRNAEKGAKAVQEVKDYAATGGGGEVELLLIDVSNDESVTKAATELKQKVVTLTAIVNNAGTGLGHDGVTNEMIMDVNVMGVKRVVDAFVDLLAAAPPTADGGGGCAKIINVGSGSGPLYVASQPVVRQKKICNPDITWEEIQKEYTRGVPPDDPAYQQVGTDHYGLSKALLMCYTMYLAKNLGNSQNIAVYCLTPGYIDTSLTSCWPGGKTPLEGTLSIRHCLSSSTTMTESGYFFGSDTKRSPIHFLRNPGEPVFDGKIDWDAVC